MAAPLILGMDLRKMDDTRPPVGAPAALPNSGSPKTPEDAEHRCFLVFSVFSVFGGQ
jgi:hypothetical protein